MKTFHKTLETSVTNSPLPIPYLFLVVIFLRMDNFLGPTTQQQKTFPGLTENFDKNWKTIFNLKISLIILKGFATIGRNYLEWKKITIYLNRLSLTFNLKWLRPLNILHTMYQGGLGQCHIKKSTSLYISLIIKQICITLH